MAQHFGTAQAVALQTKPTRVGSLARAGRLRLPSNGFSRTRILRYLKPRLALQRRGCPCNNPHGTGDCAYANKQART
ncbi:MAG: hypothetical protein NZ874_01420 [Fimbriimonadales bacterium]|nr:hypothetical protein [Fimbriimonadales bacterium]